MACIDKDEDLTVDVQVQGGGKKRRVNCQDRFRGWADDSDRTAAAAGAGKITLSRRARCLAQIHRIPRATCRSFPM